MSLSSAAHAAAKRLRVHPSVATFAIVTFAVGAAALATSAGLAWRHSQASDNVVADAMRREAVTGDYAAWTYFQSVDSPVNDAFVSAFKRRYGEQRVTDDPIEVSAVGRTIVDRSIRGPGGMVFVDSDNRRAWKTVRIGKIRADGQFDIVWTSDRPVRPVPYPAERSRDQWNAVLQDLYRQ